VNTAFGLLAFRARENGEAFAIRAAVSAYRRTSTGFSQSLYSTGTENPGQVRLCSGNGECIGAFQLPRGGISCFFAANPRLHGLKVRVVLGSKLPPSLVCVGDPAHLRRQRHD